VAAKPRAKTSFVRKKRETKKKNTYDYKMPLDLNYLCTQHTTSRTVNTHKKTNKSTNGGRGSSIGFFVTMEPALRSGCHSRSVGAAGEESYTYECAAGLIPGELYYCSTVTYVCARLPSLSFAWLVKQEETRELLTLSLFFLKLNNEFPHCIYFY
jgi:hypothetical protein